METMKTTRPTPTITPTIREICSWATSELAMGDSVDVKVVLEYDNVNDWVDNDWLRLVFVKGDVEIELVEVLIGLKVVAGVKLCV